MLLDTISLDAQLWAKAGATGLHMLLPVDCRCTLSVLSQVNEKKQGRAL